MGHTTYSYCLLHSYPKLKMKVYGVRVEWTLSEKLSVRVNGVVDLLIELSNYKNP